MKRRLSIIAILCCGAAFAAENAVFNPPKVYSVERYEAGWSKNPFTLKTAPAAVENAPFAKDLAIGTYYGDAADPTVVIVNTKTNERARLKKGLPASNGMKLGSVKLGSSRKDIAVEVTLGAETSEIRFDDSYLKQMAAAEATKTPAIQQQMNQQQMRQQPGAPLRIPMPQPPNQSIKVPQPGVAPSTVRVGAASVAPVPRGIVPQLALTQRGGAQPALVQESVPQPAVAQGSMPQPGAIDLTVTPAVNGTDGNVNLTVSVGSPSGTTPSTPLVSQVANPDTAPVPVRRRFITPVPNAPTAPSQAATLPPP